jgi:hypothetical protein
MSDSTRKERPATLIPVGIRFAGTGVARSVAPRDGRAAAVGVASIDIKPAFLANGAKKHQGRGRRWE